MPEWYVIVLIFCARLLDVPIGTVRMIMVMNGHRYVSAFLASSSHDLDRGGRQGHRAHRQRRALVAYGAGFALGTLIGMNIEQRLAIGWRVIRVINPRPELT